MIDLTLLPSQHPHLHRQVHHKSLQRRIDLPESRIRHRWNHDRPKPGLTCIRKVFEIQYQGYPVDRNSERNLY
jgi:hypothetical protein